MSLLCKNWLWVMLAPAHGLFTMNDTSEHFFTILDLIPFFDHRKACVDTWSVILAGFILNE